MRTPQIGEKRPVEKMAQKRSLPNEDLYFSQMTSVDASNKVKQMPTVIWNMILIQKYSQKVKEWEA